MKGRIESRDGLLFPIPHNFFLWGAEILGFVLYGGAKKKNNGIRARNTSSTFRGDVLPTTPTHFSGVLRGVTKGVVGDILE